MNEDNAQMNIGDKKRLEKVGKYLTDREFSMFEEVSEIKEHLEGIHESLKSIAEKETPMMEMPEVHKVSIEGAEVLTIKGEKGEKGDEPNDERLTNLIKPLIPKPIVGQKGDRGEIGLVGLTGKDGVDGVDGKDGESIVGQKGEDGKDGSSDTSYQIIDKLEEIDNEKEKLRISAIQDLEKRLDELEKRPIGKGGGGTSAIGVARAFKYIAHTKQPTGVIDGVNLTYIVPGISTIWWIAGFTLNGENIAELPNFTYSGATITFASALPAAYSGKDFEVKLIGT